MLSTSSVSGTSTTSNWAPGTSGPEYSFTCDCWAQPDNSPTRATQNKRRMGTPWHARQTGQAKHTYAGLQFDDKNPDCPRGATRFWSFPTAGSEVVAQADGEAGRRFVQRATRGGGATFLPGRQLGVLVVGEHGVVGIDAHRLVQLVLDAHGQHVAVAIVGIGAAGQPHGLDRGVGRDLEFATQAVDVGGRCFIVVDIRRLVETDQFEIAGQLVRAGQANSIPLTTGSPFINLFVGQCGFDR